MTNTSKRHKKAALICFCCGGPKKIYEKYAEWTVRGFIQIGASRTKTVILKQIPKLGDIKGRADYIEKVHEIARWVVE